MSLHQRFRGCLLGVLAGDCIGCAFEGRSRVTLAECTSLMKMAAKAEPGDKKARLYFTDDTVMSKVVAVSLLEMDSFVPSDMLIKFTDAYKEQPRRGYGGNVIEIFRQVWAMKKKAAAAVVDEENEDCSQETREASGASLGTEDPYGPARAQFDGSGSYGNGTGMRAAPVALFCASDRQKMLRIAEQQSMLTHTHADGVMGGVLQASSVWHALRADPARFDLAQFLADVSEDVQTTGRSLYPNKPNPYHEKLSVIQSLLDSSPGESTVSEVVRLLGNSVRALDSIPTALYCFLRCTRPDPELEELVPQACRDPISRTIAYAVSLGGDTDTIASMAAAIAGALYGERGVPKSWHFVLEGCQEMMDLADQLYSRYDSIPTSVTSGQEGRKEADAENTS